MSWAELRDLVDALPEDSATKAAVAGDVEGRRWSTATYLQAAQYNALIMLTRLAWAGWQLKGTAPELKPVPPPRLAEDEAVVLAKAAKEAKAREYLDRMSPRREQPEDAAAVEEWKARIRALQQQSA